MEEEKIVVIEDEVEFFNKYRNEAKEHLLFYEKTVYSKGSEFRFYTDDGVKYVCRGEKAKAYFGLMEGKMNVFAERITYEVAE